jgi:phosphoglycerate dehydrogenase-like enzyme
MTTILYPEGHYADDSVEQKYFPPGTKVIMCKVNALAELPDAVCAETDALMIMFYHVTEADLARFPKLKVCMRMGVGYDIIDRAACARRNIMVLNIPDYGTTEVADHAMALALALRRGIALYYDTQRGAAPAPWKPILTPLIRRLGVQRFGVVGLGRIGTAVALRAKAFNFQVSFYDPYKPAGTELSYGISRAKTLNALMEQCDVVSVHAPLTPETRGLIGLEQLRRMPAGAVLVNTARGPIVDWTALETVLREGHLAGAGMDVIPVEPPTEPIPALLRAYRAKEEWLNGRLIVTPHAAFRSPEAWDDIRTKAAETLAAALFSDRPYNVITPEMF